MLVAVWDCGGDDSRAETGYAAPMSGIVRLADRLYRSISEGSARLRKPELRIATNFPAKSKFFDERSVGKIYTSQHAGKKLTNFFHRIKLLPNWHGSCFLMSRGSAGAPLVKQTYTKETAR
jgi:hypothetical protein